MRFIILSICFGFILITSLRIIVNDGLGTFAEHGDYFGVNSANVVLGDVDLDGDLDACTVFRWGENDVWINDGTGRFASAGPLLGVEGGLRVALGDLDNDGHPDAIVGNERGYGGTKVYFNETDVICCICADCTEDGTVNILDVIFVVNCILGISPSPCSCDCNRDGTDNILDALCIVNIILNNSCP